MEVVVDPKDFKAAMARFASGVTVVKTRNADGTVVGFTASAFSSLSLDPPLLLVCLQKDAECYAAFMEAEQFVVSILAVGQSEIAVRFATKAIDKLDGTPLQDGPVTGIPFVEGASAWMECRMHERVDAGDHTILIGEVLKAASTDSDPLLFLSRRFGRFAPDEA